MPVCHRPPLHLPMPVGHRPEGVSGKWREHRANVEMLREINTGKVHTEEAKEVMRNSWAQRKLKSDNLELDLLNEIIPSKSKKGGKIVVVTNIATTAATEYKSISEAATVLNLTRVTLRKYIKNKEIFNMLKESESGLVKEMYLITLKDKT